MGSARVLVATLSVAAAALASAGLAPPIAHAQCGLLGLFACPPSASEPPLTGPDPGGVESPDQPVPPQGKSFGFNTQLLWSEASQSIVDFEVGKAAQVGANVQRLTLSWSAFQPTSSSPPLSRDSEHPRGEVPNDGGLKRLDRLYDAAAARGIRLILIVNRAPLWATAYAHCKETLPLPLGLGYPAGCEPVAQDKRLYPTRDHLPALEAFVRALGERYPGVIFEVWNEPNWDTGPQAGSGSLLGEMTCAVYRAAKRLPDRNLVLSPGFGKFNNGSHPTAEESTKAYVDGFYSTGTGCYDGFSMHTYNGASSRFGADSPLADHMRLFRDARSAHGDSTPIWVTEFGFTTSGTSSSEGGPRVDEAAQAELLRRQYNRLVTMPDVEAAIAHTLRDAPEPRFSHPGHREYGYGWLREDGSPKPAWCTFAALSGQGSC